MHATCKRCRARAATGVWLLDEELVVLCAHCGLGYYPTTKHQISFVIQLNPDAPSRTCSSPMRPTGIVTKLPNGATFLEMACTKCDYLADFPIHKAIHAQVEHTHERYDSISGETPAFDLPPVQLDEGGSENHLQS